MNLVVFDGNATMASVWRSFVDINYNLCDEW